nr:MAG TPA: hypothetical protein [Bacteriophage sp.]DAP08516.1 MAG TPA: hypothetical protein [Bacteriophage sp.]DAU17950.1 MAG TPA: hypothetical protein [Bacteriophage sp.]
MLFVPFSGNIKTLLSDIKLYLEDCYNKRSIILK